MTQAASSAADRRALLRLARQRLRARVRRPNAGDAITLALPAVLVAGALWSGSAASVPELATRGDAAALGMLLAAAVAFLSYGMLFRAADDPFLRRLGVESRAVYAERAARLLAAGLALVVVLAAYAARAGRIPDQLLPIALVAVLTAWGSGAAATTLAGRAMVTRSPGSGWGCLTVGMWDREVAAAAPLVYAPLIPLLSGGAAGAAAFGTGWPGVGVSLAVALVLARLGARWWEAAIPRFGPQLLEMAFAPPPPAGVGELSVGRGLARLLPRAAAAVWARDGVVTARRFAWATRIVWPVAIVTLALLARRGTDPGTRGWVALAALSVWMLQMVALVGLGRYERGGRRWLDRSLGITPLQRVLGRWAFGWGASLWLGVPLALAWGWWTDAGPGWPWVFVGAGTAAVGAIASVTAAGWR
ncbi:MAG: hypothetical protein KY464_00870 [Gemmatimonadetes bacterium]|nr:hypothetical protein [Gemmatimonadota bacterium]